jgi:hypothetical protein
MTDTYEPEPEDAEEPTPRDLRHKLAERSREADELKAQVEALQREAAFAKAGIDPTDKRMDYFVKGYDGPTEADAIRAAATEAGFLTDTPPPPPPEPPSRIAAASSGAGTPAHTNLADSIASAKTAEEVMAIVESEQAAAAGLRSVRQNQ